MITITIFDQDVWNFLTGMAVLSIVIHLGMHRLGMYNGKDTNDDPD